MAIWSGEPGLVAAIQRPSGESAAAELTEPQSLVLHGSDTFPCQSIVPPWMHPLPAGLSGPLTGHAPRRETRFAVAGSTMGELIAEQGLSRPGAAFPIASSTGT